MGEFDPTARVTKSDLIDRIAKKGAEEAKNALKKVEFDPLKRVTKDDLWGIPGTSKVPNPEKELKKVIDKGIEKGTKEFQHEVNDITKKGLSATKKLLKDAAKEIEDGLTDAFTAVAGVGVKPTINSLIDMAQSKVIKGPVRLHLWWVWINVDVNDKVDVLQRVANHLPTSKKGIIKLIHELTDDDEVTLAPRLPFVGELFRVTMAIGDLEKTLDKVLHKLGL